MLGALGTDPYVPDSGIRRLPRVLTAIRGSGSAAGRTRSVRCDTLPRRWVRRVCVRSVFPSGPVLGSAHSAAGCPTLFAGFIAVGSEEARSRAGLRPPPKLHVRICRMQLSR